MAIAPPSSITQLLASAGQGDIKAQEELFLTIYEELRRLAQSRMARERKNHTLQPTALVHEAFCRLFSGEKACWANRKQFFAAAGKAMRRILVDYARMRNSDKRGGGLRTVPIQGEPAIFDRDLAEVLAVNEVLNRLEQKDPRQAQVVQLRYYADLSIDETAEALGVSPSTVDKDWNFARTWLYRELSQDDSAQHPQCRH